jgi:4-amino-4-deoxy-L-arabinose transferase-like glycosyltransferase
VDVVGSKNVRTIFLLALVPVSLIILSVSFWLLPSGFITPFNSWLLIEAGLGFAFLVSYYLSRKYHLTREVPFIIAGLFITLVIVLSYVTIEVQRLAFTVTAIASCVMYYRLGLEFKRRKYT